MNKAYIVILAISINVFAYSEYSTKGSNVFRTYKKNCIDNVFYISGKRVLSVWINPKTLKPSNCKQVIRKNGEKK
jgi:hypothetical protein